MAKFSMQARPKDEVVVDTLDFEKTMADQIPWYLKEGEKEIS